MFKYLLFKTISYFYMDQKIFFRVSQRNQLINLCTIPFISYFKVVKIKKIYFRFYKNNFFYLYFYLLVGGPHNIYVA